MGFDMVFFISVVDVDVSSIFNVVNKNMVSGKLIICFFIWVFWFLV